MRSNYILQLVKKIKASGCNVLLIQKSILRDATNDLALHYLAKAKILVVRDIERDEIEYVAKTLGLQPIAHPDNMKPEKLGDAALVEEISLGTGRVVKVTGVARRGATATVLLRGSNERLARVIIRRQPESRSLTMVFQLPHGAWLPGGVQWQVDEGEVQRLAFQTSDADGLYSGLPVTDDLLVGLRRGTTLKLAAVSTARRELVTLPLPLGKFAEAFTEFSTQERAR